MSVVLVYAGASAPPYGLMSIAGVLEQEGIEVSIADFTDEKITRSSLREKIRSEPELIGFSSYSTPMIARAVRLTGLANELYPDTFKIWGGVHATLFPEQTLNQLSIDAVCIGEGEYTMLELARNPKQFKSIKGIWFKEKEKSLLTGIRPFIKDLEKLPSYPWHLIDMSKYAKVNPWTKQKRIILIESRGCPFRCTFCYTYKFFGGTWRGRSVENVLNDFRTLHDKYGVESVELLDDLPFGGSRKKMLEFCKKIEKTGMASWDSDHRVNLVDKETLTAMKKSGCTKIYFGVESGSERMLRLLDRNTSIESILKAFELCFEIGIKTFAGFMVGLPTGTLEDLKQSYLLARKLDATQYRAVNYVPYAGTPLYELAKQRGFEEPKNMVDWANVGDYVKTKWNFSDVESNIVSEFKNRITNLTYRKALKYAKKHRDSEGILPILYDTFSRQHRSTANLFRQTYHSARQVLSL